MVSLRWVKRIVFICGVWFSLQAIQAQHVTTLREEPSGDDMHYYDGFIYSTDYGGTVIRKIDVATGHAENILTGYPKLGAIEVANGGTVYATNYDFGFLIAFKEGAPVDTLITGMAGPAGITSNAAENLIINQNQSSTITLYEVGKGLRPLHQGQPLFWNTAITMGENSDVYSNNMWTGEIIMVDAEGRPQVITELPAALDTVPDLGYMEFVEGVVLALHQGSDCLYAVDPQTGFYVVVVGIERQSGYTDGALEEAQFEDPIGIELDKERHIAYITDGPEGKQRLRTVYLGEDWSALPDFGQNPLVFMSAEQEDNEQVRVEVEVREAAEVGLEVRNGADVLVHEESSRLEAGVQTVRVGLQGYTPGAYFITLHADGFIKTFKVERSASP